MQKSAFLGLLKYKAIIRQKKCTSGAKGCVSKACVLHSNAASLFNLNFCRKNLKIVLTWPVVCVIISMLLMTATN